MRKLVNIFLILTQVFSNAVYVLFIAQNIQPVRKTRDIVPNCSFLNHGFIGG